MRGGRRLAFLPLKTEQFFWLSHIQDTARTELQSQTSEAARIYTLSVAAGRAPEEGGPQPGPPTRPLTHDDATRF